MHIQKKNIIQVFIILLFLTLIIVVANNQSKENLNSNNNNQNNSIQEESSSLQEELDELDEFVEVYEIDEKLIGHWIDKEKNVAISIQKNQGKYFLNTYSITENFVNQIKTENNKIYFVEDNFESNYIFNKDILEINIKETSYKLCKISDDELLSFVKILEEEIAKEYEKKKITNDKLNGYWIDNLNHQKFHFGDNKLNIFIGETSLFYTYTLDGINIILDDNSFFNVIIEDEKSIKLYGQNNIYYLEKVNEEDFNNFK